MQNILSGLIPGRAPTCLLISIIGLSACDEVTVTQEADTRTDQRAARSCVAAVNAHTNTQSAALNTTVPVIEVNRYIVDTANGMWTCITSDEGRATEIARRRP